MQGVCYILEEMANLVAISYYLYFSSIQRFKLGLSVYCLGMYKDTLKYASL